MIEYSPVSFPCEAFGCGGEVWVTDQRTLHWYNNFSGGERPKGYRLCETCEARIRTATVACLNEDTGVSGDHGCIGNGGIVIYEVNPKAAWWYVMNGCRERPRMYPYCDACRHGVVFTGPCRNRGCRGDGVVRCTGDEKQGQLFLVGKLEEASFWPVRNCRQCRDFISGLRDRALICECCKRHWKWSQGRQIHLVRHEPRSAFMPPTLCDSCLTLTDDERKVVMRGALSAERRRAMRRSLAEAVRSVEGCKAIRATTRRQFLAAAQMMFHAPEADVVQDAIKSEALVRVGRVAGNEGLSQLREALVASGTDSARIAALLANPAIFDSQAGKVVRALAKLATGGEMPKGFAARLRPKGGLPMTTGLAGTASPVARIAQAAAYELHATAAIEGNRSFPYPFRKHEIASFHYRFQHNRYNSESSKRSYEGDVVIQHDTLLPPHPITFVDFKHSITGKPSITHDEVERLFHALTRGEVDHAVIVSNVPLKSSAIVDEMNARITALNRECGDHIEPIRTYVQPW